MRQPASKAVRTDPRRKDPPGNAPTHPMHRPVWSSGDSGEFDLFKQQVAQSTRREDLTQASEVVQTIPIYTGETVAKAAREPHACRALAAEWAWVVADGPGIDIPNVIAATAEGCPFPINLDRNPLIGGRVPRALTDHMAQTVRDCGTKAQLDAPPTGPETKTAT